MTIYRTRVPRGDGAIVAYSGTVYESARHAWERCISWADRVVVDKTDSYQGPLTEWVELYSYQRGGS